MKKLIPIFLILCSGLFIAAVDPECSENVDKSTSRSGVQIANAEVKVQASGKTIEQENVSKRLELENIPGAIQHLYVLSAYSGQVLLYSTVKGKVTSSGKRLSPSTKVRSEGSNVFEYYPEVLGDDGTYGPSIDYLFWWDAQGLYHQQYVAGGIMIHISNQPMQFGRVTIQVEAAKGQK
jgi:hypothetical protein